MNVGMNIIFTIIGVSAVMSSIMGLNATKRISADAAAMQKITKVEWRTIIESDSFVANQFDMKISKKIWIKQEVKKSFSKLTNSVYPVWKFRILRLMDYEVSLIHEER